MPIIIPSKCIFQSNSQKIIKNQISNVSIELYDTERKTIKKSFYLDTQKELQVFSEGLIENASTIQSMKIDLTISYKQLQFSNDGSQEVVSTFHIINSKGEYQKTVPVKIDGNHLYQATGNEYAPYKEIKLHEETFKHSDGYDYKSTILLKMTDNLHCLIRVESGHFVPPDIYFELSSAEFTLTIDGIEKDLSNNVKTITETSEVSYMGEIFKIPSNELLQSQLTNCANSVAENIIKNWENGKETATIRCSISNYYDEHNSKIIDISGVNSFFKIGDKVVPMVCGSNGLDVPMSRHMNGVQKEFEVIGKKMIYDGAVWQELTLREVRQSE